MPITHPLLSRADMCTLVEYVHYLRNDSRALNLWQALEEMAAKHGGRVTCPRSGEEVGFSSLRKVFVS
jgi:hypothetical protein